MIDDCGTSGALGRVVVARGAGAAVPGTWAMAARVIAGTGADVVVLVGADGGETTADTTGDAVGPGCAGVGGTGGGDVARMGGCAGVGGAGDTGDTGEIGEIDGAGEAGRCDIASRRYW